MNITHLLYLHGFRSSPQSTKARQVAAWVAQHRPDLTWWCPQLPPSPREAVTRVMERLSDWPAHGTAVIGSSLGGFYACLVAERTGCRAVLLNPAVDPARDLARHIGETTAWHSDERFYFRPAFIDELRALAPVVPLPLSRPERILAIVAKGDEVLDWREMAALCTGCTVKLLEGGDHALGDFAAAHLPDVIDFLGLDAQRKPWPLTT
jgi:predicted esterase YcpF (UPF0227 family)